MMAQNTECHIVNTASGAGLMVGSGSTPYAVTKHAVVALSEALYLALQQKKSQVKASVLCPGMVRTNIGEVERNRPAELQNEPVPLSPELEAGREAFRAVLEAGMAPERVAEQVFDAIQNEKFYILTHSEWTELIQLRTDKLLRLENPVSPIPTIMRVLNPARYRNFSAGPSSRKKGARTGTKSCQVVSISRTSSSHSAVGSASRIRRCR